MKTIAMFFALMISASISFASAPCDSPKDNPKSTFELKEVVRKQISRYLVTPKTGAQTLSGEIEVSIKVDEDGKLEIVHMKSNNAELARFISRQLHKVDLKGDYSGNDDVLRFRFIYGKQA